MQRILSTPRPGWRQIVESQGFLFHDADDTLYWDESAYYSFSQREIDELEAATYALDKMCLSAAQYVIDHDLWDRFGIPRELASFIKESWEKDEASIYGRFDLSYDGRTPPKMLEYNADTPTALLEAAVIQWQWMKDKGGTGADQFNSIHERLIEAWSSLHSRITGTLYFTSLPPEQSLEDYVTVSYLRDTAIQAGLTTEYLPIQAVGWNEKQRSFMDLSNRPILNLFKLYPWEWLVNEKFGANISRTRFRMNWLEAPWKMILSNKAILPLLYSLNPGSPYLLRAGHSPGEVGSRYVRKPLLGREGANITIVQDGRTTLETGGDYGDGPYIYQEMATLPEFNGNYPVIGSWMVNGYACGIGIREDRSPVTGNLSRFVPHLFTSGNWF